MLRCDFFTSVRFCVYDWFIIKVLHALTVHRVHRSCYRLRGHKEVTCTRSESAHFDSSVVNMVKFYVQFFKLFLDPVISL